MSDNHYAPARVADNAGRAQIFSARFAGDIGPIPGTSFAWGNWVDLVAAVSGNWWALGAYVRILGVATAGLELHVQAQLATGPADSEVPFATFGDAFGFLVPAATGTYVVFNRTFLFPPLLIPDGTKIRIRGTVSDTGTTARTTVSLFGVPAGFYQRPHPRYSPDAYMRGRRGMAPSAAMGEFMILPTPLTTVTVATGNAAFGNWVTVITAANQTQPLLVTGLKTTENVFQGLLGKSLLAEIGIGEAAGAVGIEEVKFPNSSGYPAAAGYLQLRRPIYIPAGSGLSLRAGSNTTAKDELMQITAVPLR